MSRSTFFLPDISGFTKFVKSTELNHSKHIIEELINIIIKNGSDVFEVAEIEGDAVFFFKEAKFSPDEILKVAKKIYIAFHKHIALYEHSRICNCGACVQTLDLKLKFIVHAGEISLAKFGSQKAKPYGDSVIAAHRLLKNKIGLDQYVLFSQEFLSDSPLQYDGEGSLDDPSLGTIPFKYLKVDHWKNDVIQESEASTETKVDLTIESTTNIPISSDILLQYISDFRYRRFWNENADEVIYDDKEINRAGTEHYCIIKGKNFHFNTVKPDAGPEVLTYGEVLKNPSPLKYLESNFLLTPVSVQETSLKLVLRASLKWKIQLLMLPLIRRKLKQQATYVLKSISDSVRSHEKELIQKLAS